MTGCCRATCLRRHDRSHLALIGPRWRPWGRYGVVSLAQSAAALFPLGHRARMMRKDRYRHSRHSSKRISILVSETSRPAQRAGRMAMDPLERPPACTGPAASLRVRELQTGSQAADQSIDDWLPGVTSVLAIRARSTAVRYSRSPLDTPRLRQAGRAFCCSSRMAGIIGLAFGPLPGRGWGVLSRRRGEPHLRRVRVFGSRRFAQPG
jgi:hypothetical protein